MAPKTTPKPFSIRMSPKTLARLDVGARRRGEAKARTAERLIDEGLRMEDHPGIVFRDGPSGRRAALAGGPDVWEVVETLKDSGLTGEQAVAATAEWGVLTHAQVHAAVRYYADFRDEVDERIAHNSEEADRRRAAWVRAREALVS
jgi:predicted DNA-binding protein